MFLQAIPEDRDGRRRLAIECAEHWIPPLNGADQVSSVWLDAAEARLGRRLPASLRSWYEALGCERDIRSLQGHFLPPGELMMRAGLHHEGPEALIEVSGGDGYLYPSFGPDEARRGSERAIAGTGFEWRI